MCLPINSVALLLAAVSPRRAAITALRRSVRITQKSSTPADAPSVDRVIAEAARYITLEDGQKYCTGEQASGDLIEIIEENN